MSDSTPFHSRLDFELAPAPSGIWARLLRQMQLQLLLTFYPHPDSCFFPTRLRVLLAGLSIFFGTIFLGYYWWDIKKHIGYVSSSLHLDYRVSTNVRNVILSGYFDSIGIYQAVSDKQHKLVQQWLDILGIDKRTADAPFHSLSWGQQRLALIVRALVKHPTLLILDEPLQGLDPLNRQLVRRFVDVLIGEGATQLLFVSHHAEDAPDCITHRLAFVPSGDGYTYQLGPVA